MESESVTLWRSANALPIHPEELVVKYLSAPARPVPPFPEVTWETR